MAYSERIESVHILDKLHWCVLETSFLVLNMKLCVRLAYAYANVGWTSFAHMYGKYTENVIFLVFFGFLSASGEQKATLQWWRNHSAHVS